MDKNAMNIFITLIAVFATSCFAQCPYQLQDPCSCSSTRYESVSIVCDKGESLSSVMLALSNPPDKIDSLTISNTPIDQLPGYAFQGYNIKKLILRNNGLRVIHPNTFSGSLEESLEELEIKGNYIDTIPQTGLTVLKRLKILLLPDNLIEYVADNAFLSYHSRESIHKLDLSANNLTAIHPTGLLGLENLSQLSLDKNLLHEIPTDALSNVPTLEDLSLGVNQITSVPRDSLPLPLLKSLSLEVNQIRHIPADSFESVPQLTYLYLGNNLLTTIDPSIFYHTKHLKVLSMSNNKDITTIQTHSFQHIPELIRLELSDCSIVSIENYALKRASNLQVVILSRNQLTHIPHDAFSNLPSVSTIDLSNNAINRIDDFAFSQLPMLNTLDLSSNRLETLPTNVIYDSLTLRNPAIARKLYLQNNPWRCDKDLAWLRQWLRDNGDVIISNGGMMTKCWTPSHLSGLDIRQTDPTITQQAKAKIGEQVRKILKPAESLLIPTRQDLEITKPHTSVNGANLVGLVLGIVLAVLVVCIILLLLIRWLLKRYETKSASSTFSSSVGSTTNGYVGSAYSGAGILGHGNDRAHRSTTNSNIYLNRPRYWWF